MVLCIMTNALVGFGYCFRRVIGTDLVLRGHHSVSQNSNRCYE